MTAPAPPWRRPGGLSLIVVILVAVGLVVAGVSMALYGESQSGAQRASSMTVQADILAGSVAAPLASGDAQTLRQYVNALAADPQIEAVGIYGLNGRLTAGWARTGDPLPAVSHAGAPAFQGARLAVSAPIHQGRTQLGSVYMRSLAEPWSRRLTGYSGIALLVLMAALLVAGLGAANASLVAAHGQLSREMAERERIEAELHETQRAEALSQLEAATRRGDVELAMSEAQMEFALRAGEMGSWTRDLSTGAFTPSDLFREHHGFAPGEAADGRFDFIDRIHPEDREAQIRLIDEAVRDRTVLETEFRAVMPDGAVRWLMVRGRAYYDDDGTPVRMTGVSMDITARKNAEERQRLLLDELNHRVKNTLATVQSIAQQTGRASGDGQAFEGAFVARINALARVHDLLTTVAWQGASLASVVAQTLAPYRAQAQGERMTYLGPDVRLGPNAAVTLGMAFHELATNAAKYGAFSTERGRIEVTWRIVRREAIDILDVVWTESGGPAVVPPQHRGFGSQFLQRALAREFDGEVDLQFTPSGLVCRMSLPLSAKLHVAA